MDVSPELTADLALARYFDHLAPDVAEDLAEDLPRGDGGVAQTRERGFDRQLAEELIRGVAAKRNELDELVQGLSRNWRVERMALVERNIIRLALYEMKFASAVPINVAINEAIELTKRFGTAEGAAFVNGLLDRAVTELQLRR